METTINEIPIKEESKEVVEPKKSVVTRFIQWQFKIVAIAVLSLVIPTGLVILNTEVNGVDSTIEAVNKVGDLGIKSVVVYQKEVLPRVTHVTTNLGTVFTAATNKTHEVYQVASATNGSFFDKTYEAFEPMIIGFDWEERYPE